MGSSMRVVLFLLLASIVAAGTEAAVSCDTIRDNFVWCFYMAPLGESVRDVCCDGLRVLNELGSTPSDRQAICGCIKPNLKAMKFWVPEELKLVATYPKRCSVDLPYPLDPAFDCNSLN